jgi:two-component system, OmpR family, heavy metal sensor histidine kinase CusS
MPSLRRSLILYFLLLMAVSLTVIGIVSHRLVLASLQSREVAETGRIVQEYNLRVQEAKNKFDDDLLNQAQSLGRELRGQYSLLNNRRNSEEQQRNIRTLMFIYPFGSFGSIGNPILSVVDFAASNTPSFRTPLFWASFSNTENDELIRKSFEGGDHPDYFQFDIPRLRRVIRGPRLTFSLPSDVETYHLTEAGDHRFDDETVEVGELRRVILRTQLRTTVLGPRGGGFNPGGPQGPPSRGGNGALERPPPTQDNFYPPVYVQCARPKIELTTIENGYASIRDEKLANVQSEIRDQLGSLRLKFGIIAVLTFLGMVFGGWFLIGRGLSPLRKLSDAVSQVNEKDFRLPVEKAELTLELVPIHGRLTQSLQALKRAFEREKEAVADISHELRTPVAGLLATIDVSLRKPRTAEQYQRTLLDCRAITKQLGGLVERVMTLAYLDAGQSVPANSPTDASEIAVDCASVIRPLAESHGLAFQIDADQPAKLTTDPDKLREVMINLLHNAIEYNRPGGSVELRVKPAAAGQVVVEVSDTGIGMTTDVRSKIFERFYRADPSRTATGVHAGLGLAIVKEYIDCMGGTICVETTPGQGSIFRVNLPETIQS